MITVGYITHGDYTGEKAAMLKRNDYRNINRMHVNLLRFSADY